MRNQALSLCLLSFLLASSHEGATASCSIEPSKFPNVFEGFFTWSAFGETNQQVVLVLDSLRQAGRGIFEAKGIEFYAIGTSFRSINVTVRIYPCTLRFELIEAPNPDAFAYDSSVGEPLIGSMSSDFKRVVGPNESAASSDVFPDFVLRAWQADDQIAQMR